MSEDPNMLAELEQVLDVYGAEAVRWPEARRESLLAFAASDDAGARLLAEARALDALLAEAPAGHASEAFKAAIVAAAVDDGSREARVIPLSTARSRPIPRTGWQAAALLAASFALGLYLGIVGLADATLQDTLRYAALGETTDDSEHIFSPTGGWLSDQEGQL
ncbi:MAG: hypothetical protein ACR2PO_14625 [Methyloligellaceae bacterium]